MATSNLVSGFATSQGAKLYFETCGEGPTLVFIHAGVSDRRMWDPQLDAFSARFRVVRYDLRGYGKSPMPAGPYANRDDLLAVLRHLAIDRATLIGCSMGGATAIDFTLEHPTMVTALVPIGAGVSGWSDWSRESIDSYTAAMTLIKQGDLDGAFELSARYWIVGPTRDLARVDVKYKQRAWQLYQDNFSPELFHSQEELMDPPAIKRLAEIKCPTMVVVGDSDTEDIRKLAQQLAREIPGARLETVDNSAHLPNLEHPAQFNQRLDSFLATLRKKPAPT